MAAADDSAAAHPPGDLRKRRRSSSVTSAASSLARAVEHKVEEALLILWDELPAWRRDNGYIVSGYRRSSNSYAGCARSVFYAHNESVNIWTHLLGSVGFGALGARWLAACVVAPRYASASRADVLAFGCFFAGAVACLGLSAAFHALSNHSEPVARWGNKLDYSGIVFLIVGSYVPALYYGLFCHPRLMSMYMSAIFILGLGCGIVSWVEEFRTPRYRPYRTAIFVGLGVSGIVPVCHGISIYGYEALVERMGLDWVLLQGFLYIFGAFLYAVRWPERSFPRTFDIWGSSHQLFHVLILLAAASHLTGMTKAFDYHHSIMGAQC
ncbi:hemolysin-III related-domain-containing protein [Biscogniauxia mediterranea]|nr:hemolysin-III related-domain-containing protein [Biscogniauxia mediterranea]